MLSGFNTNIRHRGVLFHVQSEDSGRAHPHIITHLYHGGTIVASKKSSYAEHVDAPDLTDVVKGLMESQHKAVLKSLVASSFDAQIRERLGDLFGEGEPAAEAPAPEVHDAPTQPGTSSAPREPAPPEPAATAEPAETEGTHAFGDGIVSEKPLDEVILGYLVNNARKRKRVPR